MTIIILIILNIVLLIMMYCFTENVLCMKNVMYRIRKCIVETLLASLSQRMHRFSKCQLTDCDLSRNEMIQLNSNTLIDHWFLPQIVEIPLAFAACRLQFSLQLSQLAYPLHISHQPTYVITMNPDIGYACNR